MKKWLRRCGVLLLALLLVLEAVPAVCAADGTAPANEVRGVWFSYLDWRENLKGKSQVLFTEAFRTVCDRCLREGVTDLFVHVRSHNDAVYPSAIYPWSTEMLTGVQNWDPLAVTTAIAHEKGLKFHAWINPYGYRQDAYAGDALLATEENIIAGIAEILARYDVDGIHFDDYFPPLGAEANNRMISRAWALCHSYGKVFGISPQGNIENNINMGADIITWMSKPGYVDYICPQLYWTDQYGTTGTTTMYSDRLARWQELNRLDLPIYVGLAAYKAGGSFSYDLGWGRKNTNLAEQVTTARARGYDGYLLFRYGSLLESAPQAELANLRNILPAEMPPTDSPGDGSGSPDAEPPAENPTETEAPGNGIDGPIVGETPAENPAGTETPGNGIDGPIVAETPAENPAGTETPGNGIDNPTVGETPAEVPAETETPGGGAGSLTEETPAEPPAEAETPDGKGSPDETEEEMPVAPFEDVVAEDYYYDAVSWAVNQGITAGTTPYLFSPHAPCTRAQTVTFLWRQAGEPAAEGMSPFRDVKPSAYYHDAVLWAVEEGITVGTGKDTFSPEETCTRAQVVTFLWRQAGEPAAEGDSPFRDVKASAYYHDAVLWAVEQGVTVGTGDETFSPDEPCQRAQIVTFMYRYFKR